VVVCIQDAFVLGLSISGPMRCFSHQRALPGIVEMLLEQW